MCIFFLLLQGYQGYQSDFQVSMNFYATCIIFALTISKGDKFPCLTGLISSGVCEFFTVMSIGVSGLSYALGSGG